MTKWTKSCNFLMQMCLLAVLLGGCESNRNNNSEPSATFDEYWRLTRSNTLGFGFFDWDSVNSDLIHVSYNQKGYFESFKGYMAPLGYDPSQPFFGPLNEWQLYREGLYFQKYGNDHLLYQSFMFENNSNTNSSDQKNGIYTFNANYQLITPLYGASLFRTKPISTSDSMPDVSSSYYQNLITDEPVSRAYSFWSKNVVDREESNSWEKLIFYSCNPPTLTNTDYQDVKNLIYKEALIDNWKEIANQSINSSKASLPCKEVFFSYSEDNHRLESVTVTNYQQDEFGNNFITSEERYSYSHEIKQNLLVLIVNKTRSIYYLNTQQTSPQTFWALYEKQSCSLNLENHRDVNTPKPLPFMFCLDINAY